MRKLRQLHLYLGCFFAPLLIYFSISGAWQLYRFNNVPKEQPSAVRTFLHEASKPHTHSTLPGENTKTAKSGWFNAISLLLATGVVMTSVIGIYLGFQLPRRRLAVGWCLIGGTILPIIFLFFH